MDKVHLLEFSGRFGNKVIQLSNLLQLAYITNKQPSFPNDEEILKVFNFKKQEPEVLPKKMKRISSKEVLNGEMLDGDLCIVNPWMGDIFFDLPLYSCEFLPLRNKVEVSPNSVAIHFRGTDFHQWLPNAVPPASYYIEAIEIIASTYHQIEKFYIFSDDYSLKSLRSVQAFLVKNNFHFESGSVNDLAGDFSKMANCDAIISSPSTFCISAGFCGKPSKFITHSKKWVESRAEAGDIFWKIISETGGNHNYSVELLV